MFLNHYRQIEDNSQAHHVILCEPCEVQFLKKDQQSLTVLSDRLFCQHDYNQVLIYAEELK